MLNLNYTDIHIEPVGVYINSAGHVLFVTAEIRFTTNRIKDKTVKKQVIIQ